MTQRTITVGMEYIGAVLSVNHYMGRTRDGSQYVKKEAKKWMGDLGWMLKTSHIEDWRQPITVKIGGIFKDKRSCPDLHNLTKVTCDAIQEVTGINDRHLLTETSNPLIDATAIPELFITITETPPIPEQLAE